MKKITLILIIIGLILLVGIIVLRLSKEAIGKTLKEKFAGPDGCTNTEECQAYCSEETNLKECGDWCANHPLVCQFFISTKELEKKYPAGPGGCRTDLQCETYCQENPEGCQEWCKKTPELCEKYTILSEEKKGVRIVISTAEQCENYWYECKEFCAKPENLVPCQDFCNENPNICNIIPLEELEMPEPTLKPELILDYYKGLTVKVPHSLYYFKDIHEMESIIGEAKELRANVLFLFSETKPEFRTEEASTENRKIKDAIFINKAHENNLFITYMPPCYFNPEKTPEEALPTYIECIAEYAQFAQEREVYGFTLHSEFDALLSYEYEWDDDLEKWEFMEKASKQALEEIKKHFTGKVGIGFCCSKDEYFNYDFSGYDYYSGMFYAPAENYIDINDFIKKSDSAISSWMKIMNKIKEKYKISTLVLGETGVCNPEIKDPSGKSECTYMRTVPCDPKEEALYYQTIFEKTHRLVNGYFINYNFAIMNVRGEPAEEVVKERYGKI